MVTVTQIRTVSAFYITFCKVMKDVTGFPAFESFLKSNERSSLKVEVHWHITQSISVQDVDKGNMIITVMVLINFVT